MKNTLIQQKKDWKIQYNYISVKGDKIFVDKIINNNYKELYNIKENCFENINDTSVFDSKQVDKEAFLNAISIAGMLLTTSCLIINEYNEKNNNNNNDL